MAQGVQLEYRAPSDDHNEPADPRPGRATAWIAMGINLGTSGLIGCLWLPIFFLPAGTGIRPMELASLSLINGVFNAAVGTALGIVAIIEGRKDAGVVRLGGLSFLLAWLLPVGLPWLVLTLAAKFHGIWLEP